MNNRIFFLFACILMHFGVVAQQSDSAELTNKLNGYLLNNFQEKIYVHTDKNSYLTGEIIWFKVYNAEAYTNLRISHSRLVYVEILNAENTPVLQTKVELSEGKGSGSLYLPITLPSGRYIMRGYTNWMKNSDASYYFHKDLAIYNTLKEQVKPSGTGEKRCSIQFFPEGGNLVSGMNSKIAFKAADNDGRSFDFRGAVISSKNDTVAKFSPLKDGIGTFYFKPDNSLEYKVLITPVNEKAFTVKLPQIFMRGAVMSVVMKQDSVLDVTVQSNLENQGSYILLVHSGYRTVFSKSLNAANISEGFKIPFKLLGDGISHFTLFNSARQALCERLYFKKPSKIAQLTMATDQKEYVTREKVHISAKATGGGKPLTSDFSLAIYKADSLALQDEDIVTSLWLTSELKGKILNASSYLSNYQAEAVDNLMLTHGWRRFKWADVLQQRNNRPEFEPELLGHIIRGRIFNRNTKMPLAGYNAFLSIPGRHPQFYTSYSNPGGEIRFLTENFNSTSGIIVQTDPRFDSLARIEISSPYSTAYAEYKSPNFDDKPTSGQLLERSVAMQVNNAFYGNRLNREYLSVVDSSAFYLKPDKVYKLDNYVRFKTMEEVLREYVSEISVSMHKKDYHLSIFDNEKREFHINAPLILIDGVPLFDEGNTLIKFDPLKIQRLEVVTGEYIYGNNIFPGIASFYTYKGDLGGIELPQQATIMDYSGIQNKREFYSPMYEGDSSAFSRLPDYRTTLFWNADNITKSDGSASVDFFTSDLPGKYIVVMQMLSKNGYCGSQVTEFNVSRKTIGQAVR